MLAIRCHGQFTFSGNADRDCSVWDRIFTLTVDCGAGEVELGRWINAFQRRADYNTSAPEYADRFMEAGTALGCADKTARGMVPNEHGTWYFGRNGNTGRLPFVLPGMGFACPLAGHPLAV